jgi:hypothetical protein
MCLLTLLLTRRPFSSCMSHPNTLGLEGPSIRKRSGGGGGIGSDQIGSGSGSSDYRSRRRTSVTSTRRKISPFLSHDHVNIPLDIHHHHGGKQHPQHPPTTQLQEIREELDYQGQVLSRVVRDIHMNHEVSTC